MSWARFTETGSGEVAFRLVIEGIGTEFCSDPAMERTTSDGRRRVCCIPWEDSGLVIEDRTNIPEATIDPSGMTVRLTETKDQAVSGALWHEPTKQWWVADTVEIADGAVLLLSTDGIAEDDVVHLGTEAMLVTGVGAGVITVSRAHWQTIAQKHWSNEPEVGIAYRLLTDRPAQIRGRRAYLYAYGEGDDLEGDGTQVWVGTCITDPRCTDAGLEWQIGLDSAAARLKGKVGGELDVPVIPRGAYYPWSAALSIGLQEVVSGSRRTTVAGSSTLFTGFYETQEAFCEALTTFLGTVASAFSLVSIYRAIPDGDRWTVQAVAGSGVTEIAFIIRSLQDGETNTRDHEVTAGDVVHARWNEDLAGDLRMVPRGVFGTETGRPGLRRPEDVATWPERRIYVGSPVSAQWGSVLVDWPTTLRPDGGGWSQTYAIDERSTADNWIVLRRYGGFPGTEDPAARYLAWSYPSLAPARSIAGGSVADLRDRLVADGPVYANRGTAPFLTSADLADWTDVVAEAAGGRPMFTRRAWGLAVGVDVWDLLSPELQLLGCFPVIDASGKVAIARLDLPNDFSSTITLNDELISVGWSTIMRSGQTPNRIEVHTGYDVRADEWTGARFSVVALDAYAADHVDRALEIKPYSIWPGAVEWRPPDRTTHEDVALAVTPLLNVFAYPHSIVEVHVSWQYLGATCGTFVRFSAPHLPDATSGTRPLEDVLGIVVGRKWVVGEEHGTLTVLIPGFEPPAYTPTARVVDKTDNGGDEWTIEVDPSMYAPAARAADTFWSAGYKCRLMEIDSESATVLTGTVVSVDTTAHTIRVQLDSTWTPGSATWELIWPNYANATDAQKLAWAFVADSTGTLDGDRADTYAP